jgi:hypothetical protein
MSDSPLFKARQAEMAKRVPKNVGPTQEQLAAFQAAKEAAEFEAELKAEQEEAKKTKKKPEPVVEAPKETFPPVLENKAIQPDEIKEEIKEDEETL